MSIEKLVDNIKNKKSLESKKLFFELLKDKITEKIKVLKQTVSKNLFKKD